MKKFNLKVKLIKNKVILVKINLIFIIEREFNEIVLGLNNVFVVVLKDMVKFEGIKNYCKFKKNEIIVVLVKFGYVVVESDFKLDNLFFK